MNLTTIILGSVFLFVLFSGGMIFLGVGWYDLYHDNGDKATSKLYMVVGGMLISIMILLTVFGLHSLGVINTKQITVKEKYRPDATTTVEPTKLPVIEVEAQKPNLSKVKKEHQKQLEEFEVKN